jgi:hypothetical protein
MGFSSKLKKVSNPTIVKRKAKQIFGSSVKIAESKSKGKKYSIITPQRKTMNFGSIDYEDFTKHKNKQRQNNYLKHSAGIRENWKNSKYSADSLSRRLLWDS